MSPRAFRTAPRGAAFAAALAAVLALPSPAKGQGAPLVDGRPGATVLAPIGPDDIAPIYSFPPNCLPIIGVPNSGINPLLANIESGPARIAVLAELTGRHQALGTAWRDGVRLAAEIANGKGGLFGRPILVETFDVKDNAEGARAAAQAAMRANPLAVLGPVTEGAAQVTVEVLRPIQVPQILGTSGLDLLALQDASLFRGSPTPLTRLLQLADHAREEFKARSAALVWSRTDYGRERRAVLVGALKRRSIRITTDAGIDLEQDGFPDLLARMRARQPDVLFLMAHREDAVRVLAALRRQGFDRPILIDGDVVDRRFVEAAGENANGLRGIAGIHEEAPVARVRAMAKQYREKFKTPATPSAINGFIAANMLKAAAERACSLNVPDILKSLRGLPAEARTVPGILMDARMDSSGHLLRDEFVFELRNQAPRIVSLQRAPTGLF